MRICLALASLFLLSNAIAAEKISSEKGDEIRSEFIKWEAQNGGPALNEKQIRAYANDARCLLKMHCFNDDVFVIGNEAFIERKNEKDKDLCRQTVIHSPEKIYVRTQCLRGNEAKSYELMENVISFTTPPRKN